jgi:hypothetical protein
VRVDVRGGERRPWRQFANCDPAGFRGLYNLVVTPDGGTCAYTYTRHLSDLYVARGIK